MDGALVTRWGASVPGREAVGLEVFGRDVARWEALVQEGRVRSWRVFFGLGRPGGFLIGLGEVGELTRILAEEETRKINIAAVVGDFAVEICLGGTESGTRTVVDLYAGTLQEAGLFG